MFPFIFKLKGIHWCWWSFNSSPVQIPWVALQDCLPAAAAVCASGCRASVSHAWDVCQCHQTVSLCSAVQKRCLLCAWGLWALTGHLPHLAFPLQGPPEDADWGTETACVTCPELVFLDNVHWRRKCTCCYVPKTYFKMYVGSGIFPGDFSDHPGDIDQLLWAQVDGHPDTNTYLCRYLSYKFFSN